MYVILVNDDDTLYGSKKERVMQRSKLTDTLVFVVPQIYRNTHNMANATVMLEYVRPVSRKYETVILTLCKEKYNDCYLQYKLPFDTNLTSEAGSVEMQLTFAWTELASDGIGIQHVRKTSATTIEVLPITAWSDIVPDSALSSLDERLIKMDAQMRAMNDYLDVIDANKVDDLVYDDKSEMLKLTANGISVGKGVSVREVLDDGVPVVDLNNGSDDSSNDTNTDHNDGCNCGCEDNVVEFGDNIVVEKPNENDNNVVEF